MPTASFLLVLLCNGRPAAAQGCQLNPARGKIQHLIHIQFDALHFMRDNPNVPSDLEQMPHLYNFIKNSGVLLPNHLTSLISNEATDMLTTLTGVYGDRHGVPVSNSFQTGRQHKYRGTLYHGQFDWRRQ